SKRDWSSDVCSSDLVARQNIQAGGRHVRPLEPFEDGVGLGSWSPNGESQIQALQCFGVDQFLPEQDGPAQINKDRIVFKMDGRGFPAEEDVVRARIVGEHQVK